MSLEGWRGQECISDLQHVKLARIKYTKYSANGKQIHTHLDSASDTHKLGIEIVEFKRLEYILQCKHPPKYFQVHTRALRGSAGTV